MKEDVFRILVDLDSIMDTRLGVLALMDSEKAAKLLHSPQYAGRVIDEFPGFDKDTFKKIYQARDKRVLARSTMTPAIAVLQDFVQRSMNKNINAPVTAEVEIFVNSFPFVLTEKEQNLILMALSTKIPLKPKMKFVHWELNNVNPVFLKEMFNTVMFYNGMEWLNYFVGNEILIKHQVPELVLFCPTLLGFIDDKVPKDLVKEFIQAMDGFQPFVNLTFLPTDNFCSYLAKPIKNPDAPKDAEVEVEFDENGNPKQEENKPNAWDLRK